MFKRRLGRSNLEVSAMGLGGWAIGGPWVDRNARLQDADGMQITLFQAVDQNA